MPGVADRAVRDASVRAPFAGLIARREVSRGEFVNVGQSLFELVALDPVEVEFHLAERDSARYAETALPQPDGSAQVVGEAAPVGQDEIGPGSDDGGGQDPQCQARDDLRVESILGQPAAREPNASQHTDGDEEPIGPEVDGAKRDGVARWAGDRGQHG